MERHDELSRLAKILRRACDPAVNLDEFLADLAAAPALAAEVVRVSNSGPWGMEGRIHGLKRAVLILGPRSVAAVAAAIVVRDRIGSAEAWGQRIETAVCAESIARRLELPLDLEAWIAGLLRGFEWGDEVVVPLAAHVRDRADVLVRAARVLLARWGRADPAGDAGLLDDLGLLAEDLPPMRRELEQRAKDVAAALRHPD